MLDMIDVYLTDNATPEFKQMIQDAHNAFERIGRENYEEGFEGIIMTDDITDVDQSRLAILQLTRDIQRQIILEFGITLSQDIATDVYTGIINGLLDLDHYDDPKHLYSVTTLDSNNEEKLAEILSLVTTYTPEDLLLDIETVTPTLIKMIQDSAIRIQEALEDKVIAKKNKYVMLLTKFCEYTNSSNFAVMDLLRKGLDVGCDFLVYANSIGRKIEEFDPKQAARELFAMALISSDGSDTPQSVITDNLENFVSDINLSTKITIEISNIQLGFRP